MGTASIPPEGDPSAVAAAIRPRRARPFLTPADPGYPRGLRDLTPPPAVVYAVGPWDLGDRPVAIVGSREANGDGRDFAERLAAELSARGAVILSGLAEGVDAAAHRGALEAGGRTGAVLGTSLRTWFPKEHEELQQAVAASVGLLTEVPPEGHSSRATFALRNRLLAALARAVVVVQGRSDSGSLLTAKAALRLGRPVGAVPWDPRDPLAEAPLGLMADHGAALVRNADDVLAMIERAERMPRPPAAASGEEPSLEALLAGAPLGDTPAPEAGRAPLGFAPASRERLLYEALRNLPQPLESVARRAGLGIAEAGAALVVLELTGRARREPGGRVRRLAG